MRIWALLVVSWAGLAHASDGSYKESQRQVKLAFPACFDGDAAKCAVVCEHGVAVPSFLYDTATKAGKMPPGPYASPVEERKAPAIAACTVACDAGHLDACALGGGVAYGFPPARRAAFHLKACEQGVAVSCANAIPYAAEGQLPGITAADLLERVKASCDAGDVTACHRLGNLAFGEWKTSKEPALLGQAVARWAAVCAADPVVGVDAVVARQQACRYALCVTGKGALREDLAFSGDPQAWACEMEHMPSLRNVGADQAVTPAIPAP